MELICREQGSIKIEEKTLCGDPRGNCDCGALVHYKIDSTEKLHQIAISYSWIIRPNGKRIKGTEYTLRKAQNDFQ